MTRRVVVVGFQLLQTLDLTGPMEVFASANRAVAPKDAYALEVATTDGLKILSSSGLRLQPDRALADCRGRFDTVLVVGGEGTRAAVNDAELINWLRQAAKRSRRVVSVCTGAYLLAAAGLLDGRRATTHWSECDRLARSFPQVSVESDPIFVHDGPVWTSAGVTAGIDLALALVEADHGADVARTVARWLVMFVQRPGGQAQFSAQLAAQRPSRSALRLVEAHVADHLGEDLSVARLAALARMSPRHFARAFKSELGTTPAAYVEALRLEAAKHLLLTTDVSVGGIARRCGFGTVATMHRSFNRSLGVTPGEYRRRFVSVAS